jgi:hypothetical protein
LPTTRGTSSASANPHGAPKTCGRPYRGWSSGDLPLIADARTWQTPTRHTGVLDGIRAHLGPQKGRRRRENRIGKPNRTLLPDRFIFREQPGTRGNIRENAGARGTLFSPVPGCSRHSGPQMDRRKGAAVRSAVLDAPPTPNAGAGPCQQHDRHGGSQGRTYRSVPRIELAWRSWSPRIEGVSGHNRGGSRPLGIGVGIGSHPSHCRAKVNKSERAVTIAQV